MPYDGSIAYVVTKSVIFYLNSRVAGLPTTRSVVITSTTASCLASTACSSTEIPLREVIQVPLIFWWRGTCPHGQRLDRPVTNAALPATLLDLIGEKSNPRSRPSLAQLWEQPDLKQDWPDPVSRGGHIPWVPAQFLTAHGAIKSVLDPQWSILCMRNS